MSYRIIVQPDPSSRRTIKYTPESLRHIGTEVEALISRHSSLKIHKRAIERQLVSIAARIHEEDVALIPRNIFLLLEMHGSGGVGKQLEQIARLVLEEGYWKPRGHVQHYQGQDVYYLGKSTQKLFDDYAVLDRRVEQVHARLEYIKQRQHMKPETSPQRVFEGLATSSEYASLQDEIEVIVDLLEHVHRPGWFSRLSVHHSSKKIWHA